MTAYTLWVKNFIKITLSYTVSEIHVNEFLAFYAEIPEGIQKWQINNIWQKVFLPYVSGYALGVKNFIVYGTQPFNLH